MRIPKCAITADPSGIKLRLTRSRGCRHPSEGAVKGASPPRSYPSGSRKRIVHPEIYLPVRYVYLDDSYGVHHLNLILDLDLEQRYNTR